MRIIFVGAFLLLFSISVSFGAGFGLYEFGARASSLGGAVVAQAVDASSVFYNPAGLAFQKGTQFYGGATFISASNRWIGPKPFFNDEIHDAKDRIHYPVGIYFAHQLNDRFSAGIGLTNPFGLGLEWEDDFPGRVISRNVDLKSFYISPVVAYRVNENLGISAGVDAVITTVTLERNALFAYPNDPSTEPGVEFGKILLEGTSKLAFGFNVSARYEMDKLAVGFLYRHQVKNEFEDGDVTVELFDTPYKQFLINQGLFVDQKASTEITFPALFMIGAHYQITEKLGFEVDYGWYKWSVFDKLELNFDKPELNTTIHEDYEDSWQLRFGANFNVTENIELRAGYIYDKTPQPIESMSPLLPDNDRNDFSAGIGYTKNNLKFDLAYMLVDFGERSTIEDGVGKQYDHFNGTYSSLTHLFMFSFGVTL